MRSGSGRGLVGPRSTSTPPVPWRTESEVGPGRWESRGRRGGGHWPRGGEAAGRGGRVVGWESRQRARGGRDPCDWEGVPGLVGVRGPPDHSSKRFWVFHVRRRSRVHRPGARVHVSHGLVPDGPHATDQTQVRVSPEEPVDEHLQGPPVRIGVVPPVTSYHVVLRVDTPSSPVGPGTARGWGVSGRRSRARTLKFLLLPSAGRRRHRVPSVAGGVSAGLECPSATRRLWELAESKGGEDVSLPSSLRHPWVPGHVSAGRRTCWATPGTPGPCL